MLDIYTDNVYIFCRYDQLFNNDWFIFDKFADSFELNRLTAAVDFIVRDIQGIYT